MSQCSASSLHESSTRITGHYPIGTSFSVSARQLRCPTAHSSCPFLTILTFQTCHNFKQIWLVLVEIMLIVYTDYFLLNQIHFFCIFHVIIKRLTRNSYFPHRAMHILWFLHFFVNCQRIFSAWPQQLTNLSKFGLGGNYFY